MRRLCTGVLVRFIPFFVSTMIYWPSERTVCLAGFKCRKCAATRSSDFTDYQALLGIVVDEHDDQFTGMWSGCGGTSQLDDSTATQEERAEPTSSPVKTLAATVKLETPRARTKAPTSSNPPTTIPESPNPKKRAVANADLPESPKRHKKEQAKGGHADSTLR